MILFKLVRKNMALNGYWLMITLLVFSGLIKLGLWQSERAHEKEQRLTKINRLLGQVAQPIDQVLEGLKGQQELNDQPVLLTGNFDQNIVILHDNQTDKGRLGYRVYQVFYHKTRAVLVNLGWVEGSKIRSELPRINAIAGEYTVKGNIRFIEQGIVLAEQSYQKVSVPLRVQQIEINKLSRLFNVQLLPFAVYLDKNETIGYKKNWQPVVMPPEKHRGYAFQWFSLAFAWLALMLWASAVSRSNKNNKNKK